MDDLAAPRVRRIGLDTLEDGSLVYRLLAVFDAADDRDSPPSHAAVAWRDETGNVETTIEALDDAPPYAMARFELDDLESDADVPYLVRGADDRARLQDWAPDVEQVSDYGIRTVPERGPERVALASCNGIEEVHDDQNTFLWDKFARRDVGDGDENGPRHDPEGADVLVMAGDQVYADSVRTALKKGLVDDDHERLAEEYRQRYVHVWSDDDVQGVLAQVPTLMMWDDHDIYNGYGSHDRDAVERGARESLFEAAAEAFDDFQASANPDQHAPSAKGRDFSLRLGDIGIVVPDGRSRRDYKNGVVLGEDQRDRLLESVDELVHDDPVRLLFFVVGVPFFHVGRKVIGNLADELEMTSKVESLGLLSDIRDGWVSENNEEAFAELLAGLYDVLRNQTGRETQLVVLSGDVHVGTVSELTLEDLEQTIPQITSSAIGYPPPSGVVEAGFETFDVFRDDLLESYPTDDLEEAPADAPSHLDAEGEFLAFDDTLGTILNHRNYAVINCGSPAADDTPDDTLQVDYKWEANLGVDTGPNDFRTTRVHVDLEQGWFDDWL